VIDERSEMRRSSIDQRYWIWACAILVLAAFNVGYRLGGEVVTEWDESLYALSALEIATSGHWIAHRLMGAVDYYNTKPPLNIWLIAGAFKLFGISLWSLRLTSAISAWLTVLTLQMWARRVAGTTAALVSSLALATMFGFLHTHSGRSGDTDALLALLMLLTVVTLETAWRRPSRYIWLGPICAGVFLLKGMAVLLPLALIAVVEAWQLGKRPVDWRARGAALLLFLVPVIGWAFARWRFDEWRFLGKMVTYDLLGSVFQPLEGHDKWLTYYVWVLQKDHLDWVLAAAVAWLAFPGRWDAVRRLITTWTSGRQAQVVVVTWAAITFLIPTAMRTKLPWYLNPFYPAFALGVGWLAARALTAASRPTMSGRRVALMAVVTVALVTAEARFVWYSFHYRDLARSAQGLLLANRARLAGQRVYLEQWSLADVFVLRALVGAQEGHLGAPDRFWTDSHTGDYLLTAGELQAPDLRLIATGTDGHRLYQRCD
jgi:4-amino-4-deoxy-L-arabinose transferase-like glycosyltransferase